MGTRGGVTGERVLFRHQWMPVTEYVASSLEHIAILRN